MKRVHAFAATLPAAIGLVVPTAAMATTATSASTHGKKVALQHPRGFFENCAEDGVISCIKTSGGGQYLSQLSLDNWANANGGLRHGYVGYFDSSTLSTYSTWRQHSKSEPKGTSYSFKWDIHCHLPSKGSLWGHVGGHSRKPYESVHAGHATGAECSGPYE